MHTASSRITNRDAAYLLMRLAIGASLFGHGLIRIPKLDSFSTWMVDQFHTSILPSTLIAPVSYVLPFAEFITGALILGGLFTRTALFAAGLIMVSLVFGSTTIENWESITSQLVHAAVIAVLLAFDQHNTYSADRILRRRFCSEYAQRGSQRAWPGRKAPRRLRDLGGPRRT